MKMLFANTESRERVETRRGQVWSATLLGTGLFLAAAAGVLPAQTASAPSPASQSASGDAGSQATPEASEIPAPASTKQPRSSDQRRAAKLYMDSSKLFLNRQFAEAMKGFEQAAELDPENNNYRLAALVARSHQVTALIQEAAKDKLLGDEAAARAALASALALDPTNFEASQHLDEFADESVRAQPRALYEQASSAIAGNQTLLAAPAPQSFHLHTD
jgi:general secretion pathway protein D